jgi:hypothetical protein
LTLHHLIALLAGCLLSPPADDLCREAREAQHDFLRTHDARDVEWHANGTVRSMKATGIFLRSGITNLEADDPAPQILEAIGPALLARGTEELRVRSVSLDIAVGRRLVVRLDEFIAGREVRWAHVNVVVLEQTNEVTEVYASFMPDRGLDHQPRLSAMETRFKVEATMRDRRAYGLEERKIYFSDRPASLGYEFQKIESSTVYGGARVDFRRAVSDLRRCSERRDSQAVPAAPARPLKLCFAYCANRLRSKMCTSPEQAITIVLQKLGLVRSLTEPTISHLLNNAIESLWT